PGSRPRASMTPSSSRTRGMSPANPSRSTRAWPWRTPRRSTRGSSSVSPSDGWRLVTASLPAPQESPVAVGDAGDVALGELVDLRGLGPATVGEAQGRLSEAGEQLPRGPGRPRRRGGGEGEHPDGDLPVIGLGEV